MASGQARGLVVLGVAALLAAGLSACAHSGGPSKGKGAPYRAANLRPYEIAGQRYKPKVFKSYDEKGLASWYNYPAGQRRRTATGEVFDGGRMAAAHKTLQLPCVVEVTNLENGRKVRVRVNDRGPYVEGRIIDLTPAAAERLGFTKKGVARVRVKLLGRATTADTGEILMAEVSGASQAN